MRALVMIAACMLGCYHPSIKDGSVYCSSDGKCPSGFMCADDGLCYVHPPVFSPYGDGHLGTPTFASTGDIILNTNTGAIVQLSSGASSTTVVPATSSPPFGVAQSNGPGVAIWSFSSLTIPAGVTVRVSPDSQSVPVLATTGTLTVSGTIDLSGSGGINGGVGANAPNPEGEQAGGGTGGTMGTSGGGGGGGHATAGGTGMATGGGAGGAMYASADLPLSFGGGGGGGAGEASSAPGLGGTGGGAIGLLGQTVDIEGAINVNGKAGGNALNGMAGGGGAGAGGTILVSGGTVTIGSSAMLTAVGGGPGMGSSGGGAGGNGAYGLIWLLGSVTNNGMSMPAAGSSPALTKFPQ
jgi:hypothetical protein